MASRCLIFAFLLHELLPSFKNTTVVLDVLEEHVAKLLLLDAPCPAQELLMGSFQIEPGFVSVPGGF